MIPRSMDDIKTDLVEKWLSNMSIEDLLKKYEKSDELPKEVLDSLVVAEEHNEKLKEVEDEISKMKEDEKERIEKAIERIKEEERSKVDKDIERISLLTKVLRPKNGKDAEVDYDKIINEILDEYARIKPITIKDNREK